MADNSVSPVLIVGAGPAGLALALSLVQNGVPVRIINKAAAPHQEARGQGIQPRTLEVFHFLGVLPELRAKGALLKPVVFYKLPGGTEVLQTTHLSVKEDDTPTKPYNNTYQVAQCHTEAILRAHLEKHGCAVEFGTELVDYKQFEDHVEATMRKSVGGGEEVVTQSFRWLVGADGGRSVVRKRGGFAFEGTAPEQRAILGEMEIEGLDTTRWHAWMRKGDGTSTIMMLSVVEGHRHFLMILGHPEADKLLSSHDALREAIRTHTDRSDIEIKHIYYTSDYRPSVRRADKFSEGRVFLVGDAAHVHAPRGGQGLNSSVQDAFNLGWKLALAVRGLAAPGLLETYNTERLPVITRMLQETEDIGRRARATLPAGTTDPAQTAAAMMQRTSILKQLRINYRWSPLVRDERTPRAPDEEMEPYGVEAEDGLRAGDRAPNATGLVRLPGSEPLATGLFDIFAPTHHTALIFDRDVARVASVLKALARWPQGTVTSVVVLPSGDTAAAATEGADMTLRDGDGIAYDAYGMTSEQAYTVIVRPDGVVGAIVAGEEGVAQYFNGIFSVSK